MKILHISDLHLGKKVNGFSMMEDQIYILKRILAVVRDEKPGCVLITGDVYDTSNSTDAAAATLSDFLHSLAEMKVPTLIISGNHDSAEKLSFASELISLGGVYIAKAYNGSAPIKPITLQDEFGPVNFYMLPFIRPSEVRANFEADGKTRITNFSDMFAKAIDMMGIDRSQRNVLLAHAFVTSAERSDSENISVGTIDNVDTSVFEPFDYVALGHLHKPQTIGSKIRYAGSPLKYSVSETDPKSVTVVELGEKSLGSRAAEPHAELGIRAVELKPLRDIVLLRGKFEDLMAKENQLRDKDNYVYITLTDDLDIPDVANKIRQVYPNFMGLKYDNRRTESQETVKADVDIKRKTTMELFSDFYRTMNAGDMSPEQEEVVEDVIKEIENRNNK